MHAIRMSIALAALSMSVNCHAVISYSAEPIEGWVVDAETGSPLQDVIVLANWELRGGMERQILGELTILEARSNRNGRFVFPGWGPKTVSEESARLWDEDPQLHFIKSGYKYRSIQNETIVGPVNTEKSVRSSRWNGKRIAMERLKEGSLDAVADFYMSDIRRLVGSGKGCEWKEMPLTVAYLLREGRRLKSLGLDVYVFDPRNFSNQDRCGSAAKWAEEISR